MATCAKDQEFNNIRWGTMMPIPVMVGGEILEVRARGNISIIVEEPTKIQTQIDNPEDFEAGMRSYFSACVNEAIGELSQSALNIEQFLSISENTKNLFKSKFDYKLSEIGLKVKSLVIEAIENI